MRQLGGDRGLAGAGDAIQDVEADGHRPDRLEGHGDAAEPDEADVRRPDPEARMEMSTVARKTVASETDPTVTAAQQREVDDAVHVANLWVDPVTTLPAPNGKGWRGAAPSGSRRPCRPWHRLVEPVSEGVTAAMTKAMDEQFERLKAEGLSGLTEGIEGLPEGFPTCPVSIWATSSASSSRRCGRWPGACSRPSWGTASAPSPPTCSARPGGPALLDTEDVQRCRPTSRRSPRVSASTSARFASTSRSARPPAPGCSPRSVARAAARGGGPGLRAEHHHRHRRHRGAGPEMDLQNPAGIQEALRTSCSRRRRPRNSVPRSTGSRRRWRSSRAGSTSSPNRRPRRISRTPTRSARRCARRRVSGPAQKTFSGLVGLELRPRRLKDAKNLWAALENAGGAEFRDAPSRAPRHRADRSRPRRPAGTSRSGVTPPPATTSTRRSTPCCATTTAKPRRGRRRRRGAWTDPRLTRPETTSSPLLADATRVLRIRAGRPAAGGTAPGVPRVPRRPPGRRVEAGPPEHLTASRLVLDERLDRVLLTHHRARGCGSSSAGTEPADRSVRAAARARRPRSRDRRAAE